MFPAPASDGKASPGNSKNDDFTSTKYSQRQRHAMPKQLARSTAQSCSRLCTMQRTRCINRTEAIPRTPSMPPAPAKVSHCWLSSCQQDLHPTWLPFDTYGVHSAFVSSCRRPLRLSSSIPSAAINCAARELELILPKAFTPAKMKTRSYLAPCLAIINTVDSDVSKFVVVLPLVCVAPGWTLQC